MSFETKTTRIEFGDQEDMTARGFGGDFIPLFAEVTRMGFYGGFQVRRREPRSSRDEPPVSLWFDNPAKLREFASALLAVADAMDAALPWSKPGDAANRQGASAPEPEQPADGEITLIGAEWRPADTRQAAGRADRDGARLISVPPAEPGDAK